MKYYKLIGNQNYVGGVGYSPDDFMKFKSLPEGSPINDWAIPDFILKNGEYRNHLANDKFKNLCSGTIKDLINNLKDPSDKVQWLPINIISEKYGDQTYFVLHIPQIFDVLNKEKTMYATPHHIIKPVLDKNKLGNHKVFGYEDGLNSVIVTEEIKKALEEIKGLKNEVSFSEIKVG